MTYVQLEYKRIRQVCAASKQTLDESLKDEFAFCYATNISFKGDGQWSLKKRKSKQATAAAAVKKGRRKQQAAPVKKVAAKRVVAAAQAKVEVNPAAESRAVKEAETRY
jgi:hypothetical protein